MVNMQKIKKWAALWINATFPLLSYIILDFIYDDYWYALAGAAAGTILGLVIAWAMLKNPFTAMVEGSGLLVLDMNSTGVIQPFLCRIRLPKIFGKLHGATKIDVWDRDLTHMFGQPIKVEEKVEVLEDGSMKLPDLSREEYSKARFSLWHYPVLIWNEKLQSFLTKDALSTTEKLMFAEHSAYAQNIQLQILNDRLEKLTRTFLDALRPVLDFLKKPWVWIVMLLVVGGLAVIFLPDIMSGMQGSAQTAVEQGATPIIPR